MEAIVAMVIFSMTAVSLYAWQGNNLRSLLKIQERQLVLRDRANAMSWVRNLNPMRQPNGEIQLGDLQLRWRAKLLEPIKPGRFQTGGISLFDLGLYELDIEIFRDSVSSDRFTVRQLGHRQPRHVSE
ncbi:MAG: hypothetical protein HYV16_16000 [Gammaproteobacteria bacterium]|nr:hypothetical protein [Gammaproteobacteria bacterium]